MNRLMQWMMAAALIFSATVLTSCHYVSKNSADSDHTDNKEKTIWVLSDIHVMAPELLQGTDKAEEVSQNSKLLQYSAEILDWVVDSALRTNPDLVLITGDLTEALVGMFRKRFADYHVLDDKAALLELFVGAYYDKGFKYAVSVAY